MTTWLTRIVTNPGSREVERDSTDMTQLHRTVMAMFPEDLGDEARLSAGVLFRHEAGPGGASVLVQSTLQPDADRLPAGYGQSAFRQIDPLLDALRPGHQVHYRIIANASRKLGRNTQQGRPLSVVPLFGAEAEEWWARQAEQSGLVPTLVTAEPLNPTSFHRPAPAGMLARTPVAPETAEPSEPRLAAAPGTADASRTAAAVGRRGRGGDGRVHIRQVQTRFDGIAVVQNPALLRERIRTGIGRGKAYGCGLLTLAPVR